MATDPQGKRHPKHEHGSKQMPLQLLHADGHIIEQVTRDHVVENVEQHDHEQNGRDLAQPIGKGVDRLLKA